MTIKDMAVSRRPENRETAFPQSPFRAFEDFFNDWFFKSWRGVRPGPWSPAIDVFEKDYNFVLRAEVPGLTEKDIEISLEGNVLTLRGTGRPTPESEGCTVHQVEGSYGAFSRSFTIPDTADLENIKADCRNGVLTITVPHKPQTRPRTIKIST